MSPTTTDYREMTFSQLGEEVKSHLNNARGRPYEADHHYKLAGIVLIAARKKVARRKDLTFDAFSETFCGIGRSWAYELISMADGSFNEEAHRAKSRRAIAKRSERVKPLVRYVATCFDEMEIEYRQEFSLILLEIADVEPDLQEAIKDWWLDYNYIGEYAGI